jgi:hypothetical protein
MKLPRCQTTEPTIIYLTDPDAAPVIVGDLDEALARLLLGLVEEKQATEVGA